MESKGQVGVGTVPTKEFVQVVLQRGACEQDAARAIEGQKGAHGLAASCRFQAVPLVTHQDVAASAQLLRILAQGLVRGNHDLQRQQHKPSLIRSMLSTCPEDHDIAVLETASPSVLGCQTCPAALVLFAC